MRLMIISKAHVVGAYQTKLEAIAAQPGVELVAVVPPSWREPGVGELHLERRFVRGYRLEVLPLVMNGHHHTYLLRGLGALLRRERPDVLHIDEESFNAATFQAMRHGQALGARCCFFNWANIDRWYPPPWAFFERYNFKHSAHAIAGNAEAAAIIRRHGYQGPLSVLPQFGVDPQLFSPTDPLQAQPGPPSFTVGFVGRMLASKGVLDLLEAFAGLPPGARLRLIGDGELRGEIARRAEALGVAPRVEFVAQLPSTEVPAALRALDALVLPSRTTPSWKEQFGRVLVEAMACGVPVVGSSSGEIPHVIGDAGLVFPEGDVVALRVALLELMENVGLRQALGQRGRERVLQHYTQQALAQRYVEIYRAMHAAPEQ
jgi:glycosyltransferase involved in cell wall biosynthesis